MRFYAVSTEAIRHTHRGLQQLANNRNGSHRASRSLRVAHLYGHLQCRAKDGQRIHLSLQRLSDDWCLQARDLRADLRDLQAMGWLSFQGGMHGTSIELHEPLLTDQSRGAETQREQPSPPDQRSLTVETRAAEPYGESENIPGGPDLINRFCNRFNWHRPEGWPAVTPAELQSAELSERLQAAMRYAGGENRFWRQLAQALTKMPSLWRTAFPNLNSPADCAAALFAADVGCVNPCIRDWRVFSWARLPNSRPRKTPQPAVVEEGEAFYTHEFWA